MSEHEVDVIVIGAGPAGEVLAGRAADKHGLEVAIVESHLVGGECSYYSCMPSKALLRPAQALAEVKRVPGAAEAASGELDVGAALERRDNVISELDDSSQLPWLEERGIALHRGRGRLDGERRVVVESDDGETVLRARRAVVVATGSSASVPPVEGLEEALTWTNREATTAAEAPQSLIVVGGGPVGVEMAQAWATLGSQVTLIEVSERILSGEEPFAAEAVGEALREDGVELLESATIERAERGPDGGVAVELEGGRRIEAEELLVAAGRRPNTESIGLDSIGLEPGDHLDVDDAMRVEGHEWLYAIGDANGRSLLTHSGKYQGRIGADVIAGEDVQASADSPAPPRVVFTEPQIAAVGPTLEGAREQGLEAEAVDVQTSANPGSSFHGRGTPGTSRLVIDRDRSVIVGATFVGVDTAELMHAAAIAIAGEVPLESLWHVLPAFPSRNELWTALLEEAGL